MIDLFGPGAYCRVPGGNLERPDIQKPIVDWMAYNIGGDVGRDPTVWDRCRMLWANAGMQSFPWLHCHTMADIQFLIQTAQSHGAPAIGLNIEDVYTDKLDLAVVGQYVQSNWKGATHLPTICWVQNGMGWQHVSFAVAALETFVDEAPACGKIADCIWHAHAEGFTQVTLMLKTKPPNAPSTYGEFFSTCHSLYTADDIQPDAPSWAAWKAPIPCTRTEKPENGGTMPLPPNAKKRFRTELTSYCFSAESYDYNWHYSQTRPYRGLGTAPQTYHLDDCSSYCALAFWWAGHHTGHPVADPLNWHYSGYGNTQSAYLFLKAHKAPKDKYRIGDMAIYGSTSNTVHMMVCTKEGTGTSARWSSFGREAGPEARYDIHYHPKPLVGVFRHPALL